MTALDRVLKMYESYEADRKVLETPLVENLAGEMVLAARGAVTGLLAYLAGDDDGDGDEGKGGDDHSGHSTFKALKKRGMDDAKAGQLCAKADKRVKAAAMAESALVCLSTLATPESDWVAATAHDRLTEIALTGRAGQPESYADPGYHGTQRFPLDTEGHTRLSLAYVSQAEGYSPEQLAVMRGRAEQAARSFGIALTPAEEKITHAELVELAKALGDGGIIMNHGPYTGSHAHSHFQSQVHAHPHTHFGDNNHDGGPQHRPGSKSGGKAGW